MGMVSEYMRDWLVIRSATVKPRTLEQYEDAARQICDAVGARDLSALTPAACAAVYAPAMAAGHERTAQILFVVLRMALRDAVGMGLLTASPMAALHRPRHDAAEIEPFSADEVRAMFAADPDRLYCWRLFYETGLRRGEACGLRWCDVDFRARAVSVRQQVVSVKGVLQVGAPKTAAGLRTLTISETLCDMLRAHLMDQVAAGRRGEYVLSPDGAMLRPSRINNWLRRCADSAGVAGAHPHRWRHTFGADAVSAGTDIRVLQKLLGHSDISVTAKYYAFVRGDVLRAAAARIADFRAV